MTEYTASPEAIAEYIASRDRTHDWISHIHQRGHSTPLLTPSVVPTTRVESEGSQDGISLAPEDWDAWSSKSVPPRMLLRYDDGRPDEALHEYKPPEPRRRRRQEQQQPSSSSQRRERSEHPPPSYPSGPISPPSSSHSRRTHSRSQSHEPSQRAMAPPSSATEYRYDDSRRHRRIPSSSQVTPRGPPPPPLPPPPADDARKARRSSQQITPQSSTSSSRTNPHALTGPYVPPYPQQIAVHSPLPRHASPRPPSFASPKPAPSLSPSQTYPVGPHGQRYSTLDQQPLIGAFSPPVANPLGPLPRSRHSALAKSMVNAMPPSPPPLPVPYRGPLSETASTPRALSPAMAYTSYSSPGHAESTPLAANRFSHPTPPHTPTPRSPSPSGGGGGGGGATHGSSRTSRPPPAIVSSGPSRAGSQPPALVYAPRADSGVSFTDRFDPPPMVPGRTAAADRYHTLPRRASGAVRDRERERYRARDRERDRDGDRDKDRDRDRDRDGERRRRAESGPLDVAGPSAWRDAERGARHARSRSRTVSPNRSVADVPDVSLVSSPTRERDPERERVREAEREAERQRARIAEHERVHGKKTKTRRERAPSVARSDSSGSTYYVLPQPGQKVHILMPDGSHDTTRAPSAVPQTRKRSAAPAPAPSPQPLSPTSPTAHDPPPLLIKEDTEPTPAPVPPAKPRKASFLSRLISSLNVTRRASPGKRVPSPIVPMLDPTAEGEEAETVRAESPVPPPPMREKELSGSRGTRKLVRRGTGMTAVTEKR